MFILFCNLFWTAKVLHIVEIIALKELKKSLNSIFLKYFVKKYCTIQILDVILHRNSRKVEGIILQNCFNSSVG